MCRLLNISLAFLSETLCAAARLLWTVSAGTADTTTKNYSLALIFIGVAGSLMCADFTTMYRVWQHFTGSNNVM